MNSAPLLLLVPAPQIYPNDIAKIGLKSFTRDGAGTLGIGKISAHVPKLESFLVFNIHFLPTGAAMLLYNNIICDNLIHNFHFSNQCQRMLRFARESLNDLMANFMVTGHQLKNLSLDIFNDPRWVRVEMKQEKEQEKY